MAKQYGTKQSMNHRRNQRGNKIPRDKWKWKHDDTKAMGWSKSSSKRTVIRINLMSGNFLKNQIKKFNLVLNEKKNKGQS